MNKKPWQKLKWLKNEKSFSDEIKSIFQAFNQANNTNFFGMSESDFQIALSTIGFYSLSLSFFLVSFYDAHSLEMVLMPPKFYSSPHYLNNSPGGFNRTNVNNILKRK